MTLSVALDAMAWYYFMPPPCFPLDKACGLRYGWLLTSSLCWCHELTDVPTSSITIYFSILQMNILCKINYLYVNLERQKKNIVYRDGMCIGIGKYTYFCVWLRVVKLCCQSTLYIRFAFLFTFFLVLNSPTSDNIIHLYVCIYS